MLEEVGVDQASGTIMERAIDGDDVTLGDELLEGVDPAGSDFLGSSYEGV